MSMSALCFGLSANDRLGLDTRDRATAVVMRSGCQQFQVAWVAAQLVAAYMVHMVRVSARDRANE
jgi:hypothetical protein